MSSRRLLVLAFVRNYMARWCEAPSQREIAHGLGISRTRVRELIKALVRSGQLLRAPGTRGLALPRDLDDAIWQLCALGWQVNEDHLWLPPPRPERTLKTPIVIDYVPHDGTEDRNGASERNRSGECRTAAGSLAARHPDHSLGAASPVACVKNGRSREVE